MISFFSRERERLPNIIRIGDAYAVPRESRHTYESIYEKNEMLKGRLLIIPGIYDIG